jgi:signal peptidase I
MSTREEATDAPPNPWIGRALEGAILIVALLLGLLVRFAWLETAVVTSGSMQPTLLVGDRLLIDHRQSLRGQWKRGDIVLFDAPENWSGAGDTLVKRVVGLPGETVAIVADRVFINNAPLQETYLPVHSAPEFSNIEPVSLPAQTLGPGHFWVMGDNRSNSDDSRSNGPLESSFIRGRATRILTPWNRKGPLSSGE